MKDHFFSVNYTTVMLGVRYKPSVCYKLDSVLTETVKELEKSGKATIYPQKVRFVSGIAVPIIDPEKVFKTPVSEQPEPKNKSRGSRRTFE